MSRKENDGNGFPFTCYLERFGRGLEQSSKRVHVREEGPVAGRGAEAHSAKCGLPHTGEISAGRPGSLPSL